MRFFYLFILSLSGHWHCRDKRCSRHNHRYVGICLRFPARCGASIKNGSKRWVWRVVSRAAVGSSSPGGHLAGTAAAGLGLRRFGCLGCVEHLRPRPAYGPGARGKEGGGGARCGGACLSLLCSTWRTARSCSSSSSGALEEDGPASPLAEPASWLARSISEHASLAHSCSHTRP